MFASRYYIRMSRRIFSRDAEDILQRATWFLHQDRYDALVLAGAIDTGEKPPTPPVLIDGVPQEEVEGFEGTYDLDVIDEYVRNLDKPREMSGAALFGAMGGDVGNGEWL
jgi:hypothetical protein